MPICWDTSRSVLSDQIPWQVHRELCWKWLCWRHSEGWVKYHTICERNYCLTLTLTQPSLSMNVGNTEPNSRVESETWRKLELSNLKGWTKKQSDTVVHLAHMNSRPQTWTSYTSITTVILFTCRVPSIKKKKVHDFLSIRSTCSLGMKLLCEPLPLC